MGYLDSRRWGRRAACAIGMLCLMLAVGSVAASSAAARNGYKAIWGPLSFNGKPTFPTYHNLGVNIYEESIDWAQIAPTRPRNAKNPHDPAYIWPATVAQSIADARRHHMRVLLLVQDAPGWANGGRPQEWAPKHPSDFAHFVTAASRKYRSVHLWMIWGEPVRFQNFMPLYPASNPFARLNKRQQVGPHLYARILNASYGALKAVSRHNLVIGGDSYTTGLMAPGKWMSPYQWVRNLRLPNGRPPRLDMYGHNPFSYRAPNLSNPPSIDNEVDFSDLRRFSRVLDRNLGRPGNRHPRLFLSEFFIPTAPDNELNFWVSRRTQAIWIRDSLRIMRHWHRIYALGWIHVYDDPPGTHGTAGGLLDYRGHPKPGYYAFKHG